MLQLLETGRALYVLAAVCLLGIVSRVVTRGLYRRLIKESENMTLTKNRSLKDLKQRLESAYRSNQGVRDTRSFLERQLYHMRFRGLTLSGWNSLSTQLTLLSVMAGGAGSFLAYWYRLDSYYIVLYGSMGVLFALLTMMFDAGSAGNDRWQQLLATLQDYVDNVLFMRLSKSLPDEAAPAPSEEAAFVPAREKTRAVERNERVMNKRVVRSARRDPVKPKQAEPEEHKDMDYLKQSLEQIAASRESNREKAKPDDNWLKDLNPEEIQLIGEIIREYLA